MMEAKCKHRRKDLFDNECILLFTSHHEVKKNPMDVGSGASDSEFCSYVSMNKLPKWITHAINQKERTVLQKNILHEVFKFEMANRSSSHRGTGSRGNRAQSATCSRWKSRPRVRREAPASEVQGVAFAVTPATPTGS
ncbi:hypothetical protein K0M31_007182 [Melipona bicolor]|uniref:Uncharacterized protein n=1 Tax=Melipona bicolor TaxID=60889 RepID=A0AA40FS42_9HYME|nr:hypothetical protein K0M31_007182 [Melipona bicolor]